MTYLQTVSDLSEWDVAFAILEAPVQKREHDFWITRVGESADLRHDALLLITSLLRSSSQKQPPAVLRLPSTSDIWLQMTADPNSPLVVRKSGQRVRKAPCKQKRDMVTLPHQMTVIFVLTTP